MCYPALINALSVDVQGRGYLGALSNRLAIGSARTCRQVSHRSAAASSFASNSKEVRLACKVYFTGWSFGGGSVLPSRRRIGPTGAELATGGGGGGAGCGVGMGGVGGWTDVPNAGGGGIDAWFPMRSARLVASSMRGIPSGGRPRRSSTVLPMLTWEFHRLSIPARTRPPNINSGTRGP